MTFSPDENCVAQTFELHDVTSDVTSALSQPSSHAQMKPVLWKVHPVTPTRIDMWEWKSVGWKRMCCAAKTRAKSWVTSVELSLLALKS